MGKKKGAKGSKAGGVMTGTVPEATPGKGGIWIETVPAAGKRQKPMAAGRLPGLEDRIRKALAFALDAVYDGAHHKMWVVDQMVRALTGCPVVEKTAAGADGRLHTYRTQGESEEYLAFTASAAYSGW